MQEETEVVFGTRRSAMRFSSLAAGILLVCVVSAPSLAASADLVSVSAHTTFATANQGGADEGSCFVSNNTSGDIRVRLDVQVVYADGKIQRLRGISDPGVLGAGGAYELNVFFVVPDDASLGTAQFVCQVTAQSLGDRSLRETEVATATFEVVP